MNAMQSCRDVDVDVDVDVGVGVGVDVVAAAHCPYSYSHRARHRRLFLLFSKLFEHGPCRLSFHSHSHL
jgi:hypothetical protein